MVFLGPSLPRDDAAAILDADWRPPARRGDIHRAARDGARVVVLIDGEFHGSPSVWPREIVDAMADGVAVHGASSMGALRAAELHTLGMVGHGRIFEWYRDGAIEADDEVALTYGPAELGWPALSEPLVNLRATLAAAFTGAALTGAADPDDLPSRTEADAALAHAIALPFAERSMDAVARAVGSPRLARWLTARRIDQKRLDAEEALRTVAAASLAPPPPKIRRAPDPCSPWARRRLAAELGIDRPDGLELETVARRHGVTGAELPELRRRLSRRFFEDRARAEGAADLGAWIADAGIRRSGLAGDALADWLVAAGPAHFGYAGWCEAAALDELLRGERP
ncbi:tfuA domain protein (plasmid) [Azospirillum sp. B510]|nr:tfuA domain protein [Azospirillum sp. B510]